MTTALIRSTGRKFSMLATVATSGLLCLLAGCGAASPPARLSALNAEPSTPAFRLVDVARERGIDFKHEHSSRTPLTIVEAVGSGCAFLDYDADGWLDVFLVNAGQDFRLASQNPGCRLYRNDGKGNFTDVTDACGIRVDVYAMGCSAGDYDGDGRLDLCVTGFGRNYLFRNQANGTFADVTSRMGIPVRPGAWGMGCVFTDVNRDGWLDLYIANYVVYDPSVPLCPSGKVMAGCTPNRYSTQRNELYINRGGTRFEDRAVALGADDPEGAGMGVVPCDFDNDGWTDLFVANDGTPNALLHNTQGRFKSIGDAAGVAYGESGVMRAGMGCDAGDYDGDGLLDLVITNFQHEPNSLYRNLGKMNFEEVTYPSGIGTPSLMRLGFGVVFQDFDGDRRPDLYVGNGHVFDNVSQFDDIATFEQLDQLLMNAGKGRFREVPPKSGAISDRPSVSRGIATGDFNNDGAPDLLVNSLGRPARLLENQPTRSPQPAASGPLPTPNPQLTTPHWLGVTLEGKSPNRFAVGARIELDGPTELQIREVHTGGSYMSQSDLRALFGLGETTDPESLRLRVRWPGGKWEKIPVTAIDRYMVVREAGARARSGAQ